MCLRLLIICLFLPACGGVAYNTRVADSPTVRAAMVASVDIGKTTEAEFVTRWGAPVQKVREGGRVDYIYRDLTDAETHKLFSVGDSTKYVIVSFQYGKAVAVRTNDTEGCRATFAPRPPGYGFDNPLTVYAVPTCPGQFRPPVHGVGVPGQGDTADGGDPVFDDGYGAGDGKAD